MKFKDKLLLVSLSIITLGFYPMIMFRKRGVEPKNELSRRENNVVDVEHLIQLLGGKDNINGAEYTQTKIKLLINDKDSVKVEDLKNLKGVTGVFATSNHISLVVGNIAKSLSHQLLKKMEN